MITSLEALFIGLLCWYESGIESPFRFYYFLSLICCAIRYSPRITFISCGLDFFSYTWLFIFSQEPHHEINTYWLTLVILLWCTWAAGAMARLFKQLSEQLQQEQLQLESRIQQRSRELEESQAQVLHQEKMAAFGLLAAGIAHEVGNPLTSISTIVQMLERRDLDTYTQDKLKLVHEQLNRIQIILRELVTFSRPVNAMQTPTNMKQVIDEALNIAKYYKGGKSRNIHVEATPQMPIIHGIRDQLVQVAFNLILNAIDATSQDGHIHIRLHAADGYVILSIQDNGTGIPTEQQGRIFQPYFTTKKSGTGLGLFVIKKIIDNHGGQVTFQSAVGHGTTFTVQIPVRSVQQQPMPRSSTPLTNEEAP